MQIMMKKSFKQTLILTLPMLAQFSFAAPKVISGIYPVQQIANAITGTQTDVIVDSPMSPHQYKIKPSDVKRIDDADLVVRVSNHFLSELSRFVLDDDKRLLDLVSLASIHKIKSNHDHHHDEAHHHEEGHDEHKHDAHEHKHEEKKDEHKHEAHEHKEKHDEHKHDENDEHGELSVDPHIWLSPDNANAIAAAIAERLVEIDPQNQQRYADNLSAFKQKTDAQKKVLAEKLVVIKGKPFVVFHDAYQYFQQAFGIEQTAMVRQDVSKGIRTKSFVMLEKALKDYPHVCVFKEPQFKSTVVDQLALNKNTRISSLDPIGYKKNGEGYHLILDDIANSMVECLTNAN